MRDDRDRGRAGAALAQLDSGHDRELVDRQRPRDAGRNRERDAAQITARGRVEHAGEHRHVLRAGENERARSGERSPRANRDDERVVLEPIPAARHRDAIAVVNGGQHPCDELGVAVTSDLGERRRGRATETERFGHRRRAVQKLGAGREQGEADVAPGELIQRQQRFQRCDSAARHDHPRARIPVYLGHLRSPPVSS